MAAIGTGIILFAILCYAQADNICVTATSGDINAIGAYPVDIPNHLFPIAVGEMYAPLNYQTDEVCGPVGLAGVTLAGIQVKVCDDTTPDVVMTDLTRGYVQRSSADGTAVVDTVFYCKPVLGPEYDQKNAPQTN